MSDCLHRENNGSEDNSVMTKILKEAQEFNITAATERAVCCNSAYDHESDGSSYKV